MKGEEEEERGGRGGEEGVGRGGEDEIKKKFGGRKKNQKSSFEKGSLFDWRQQTERTKRQSDKNGDL